MYTFSFGGAESGVSMQDYSPCKNRMAKTVRERKRKKRSRGSGKKLLRLFICEIYVIISGNKWTLRRNQRRTIAEFCFDARPAPHKIRTPALKLRDSLLVWEIIALPTVFCVDTRAIATVAAAAAAHKHLPTSSRLSPSSPSLSKYHRGDGNAVHIVRPNGRK